MVTTGAITNRIDRLRGVVASSSGPCADDRRKVIVRLTPAGLELVDEVVLAHVETERELLAALSARQRSELAPMLRTVLLGLGDAAGTGRLAAPPV